MAITKYTFRNPIHSRWGDVDLASSRLARFFDDWPSSAGSNGATWVPAVNVSETKDDLVLTAELPGLSEENITVELENDVLSISGEKTGERTEGDDERRYHVWERRHGSFQRSFTLPRTIKSDEITARFDAGVLTINLPKVPEAKGRRIEIAKN